MADTTSQLFYFASFSESDTPPVPCACWRCGQVLLYWKREHAAGVCHRCYIDLLNKVVRQKKRAGSKGCEATLTTAQWAAKLRLSQGCCYYCHKFIGYRMLSPEHMLPIAKGGGTTSDNCVPACMRCNLERWVGKERTV